MSSPPVIPPRPSKSTPTLPPEVTAPAPPTIPARPVRNRSKSPLPQSHPQSETTSPISGADSTASSGVVRFEESSPEHTGKIDPNLDLHHPMAVRPSKERAKNSHYDDSGLPPEIGQRVPMLPYAGDVQAPPLMQPDSRSASRSKRRSIHGIKSPQTVSEEGLIVGDFGAYPSGNNIYKQGGTYSLSHEDLAKSVMQTVNGPGVATHPGVEGVPDEEIGYLATDEIASRQTTGSSKEGIDPISAPGSEHGDTHKLPDSDEAENNSHGIYGSSGITNESTASLTIPASGKHSSHKEFQDEHQEGTPILASDEVGKSQHWNPPAVSPRLGAYERRPSAVAKSRQSPAVVPEEDISEPPSPIREHKPLFPEGAPPTISQRPKLSEMRQASSQRFPSKDIWEDAPESAHVTYEVQSPVEEAKPDPDYYDPGEARIREAKQKELEAAQLALAQKDEPSKDASVAAAVPPLPTHRPAKRDGLPQKPSEPKQAPTVPERPKPSIPPRPARKTSEPSSATGEGASSPEELRSPPMTKPKPATQAKVGGGIAALHANFMSDLNSRLSKGPMAPKKEEPVVETPEAEPKEREPLEDVRKSRARGPVKRKPAAAATADAPTSQAPKLTFSSIITVYSIGDDYEVTFDETKFDDEPSGVTEEKIAGLDTSKQVTAVDVDAIVSEPKTTSATEETTSSGPVEATKDAAQTVIDTIMGSVEETKTSEPTSEEIAAVV